MPNDYLINEKGLNIYHKNMIKALEEKANKVHVGSSEPDEKYIDTWLDTEEETDVQSINLEESNEELYFESDNNDISSEELTFNDDIE